MLETKEDPQGHWNVRVQHNAECSISVETGALEKLGPMVRSLLDRLDGDECIVVTEPNCAEHHLGTAERSLRASGVPWHKVLVPPGERAKSLTCATYLWEQLVDVGVTRRSILLAFGGGVICDLVGFVAASFMRGLPYVNVPTSLLGQVDGAIGGKVAIDYAGTKNLIGAFYHPHLVLVDPLLLTTLPHRELRSGLAEAVKVALIRSEPLFRRLELLRLHEYPGEPAQTQLGHIIEDAIRLKLELLADDPFEHDLNRELNLGHTIGHALEAATDFTVYRHGESVAIGLAVMTRLAFRRGLCDAAVRDRILGLLRDLSLDTFMPAELIAPTIEQLQAIARIRNGRLRSVLPQRIGSCVILEAGQITEEELRWAAVDSQAGRGPDLARLGHDPPG